ncbi:hypothetical protein AAG906_028654 [Vitis piasezkii]
MQDMTNLSYANGIGSIMYVMVCMKPNIAYGMSLFIHYMSNLGKDHWEALKWILRYLKVFLSDGLVLLLLPWISLIVCFLRSIIFLAVLMEMVIVRDTAVCGRPNVAKMSVETAQSWKAEVVVVTSNPHGSRDVIGAWRAAGLTAFGPIWDS